MRAVIGCTLRRKDEMLIPAVGTFGIRVLGARIRDVFLIVLHYLRDNQPSIQRSQLALAHH